MLTGVDVSVHNGVIDWKQARTQIDFAIIRAGYGKNNVDARCIFNINGCIDNDIPFGLYWFSYALNEEMAINEAEYICNIADNYHPQFPICFDWEYDSDNYASKNGITLTNNDRQKIAKAFLNRVEERGYYAMLYSNLDYLNKGFKSLTSRYDLWLALWQTEKPNRTFGIWQATSKGKIAGIKTDVDINYTEKEYGIATGKTKKQEFIEEMEKIFDRYF